MKKFLIGVFALFFVACSQTSSVISLNPYLSKADQTVSDKSVNINAINDQRENQMVIAVINDNDGKLVDEVLLKNNLSAWFDKALRAELEARGVRIDPASPNIVTVNIRSISAAINGYSKENMIARGEVQSLSCRATKPLLSAFRRIRANLPRFARLDRLILSCKACLAT